MSSEFDKHMNEIQGNVRKLYSHQKHRGPANRKQHILSSTMKRRKYEKINTIEHTSGQGKELNNIQGKRLYENDDELSRGDHGNLLNDVDAFEKNFNGSNFDI